MSWFLLSSKALEQFIIVCFFSDWLHPVYKTQWAAMLSMSQNRDPVPSAEKFGRDAIRCGRILERSSSVSYCCRALQSSYKHVQMRQYCLIKQVCSGVKFFTPGGSSDFICHASLIDWKILNLNCGKIYKGMHDHHSYIHNLNLREKRLLLLLKKKIKIEQDLKPWPLQ